MNILKQAGAFIIIQLMFLTTGFATNSTPVIKVGIAPAPPFAMKNANGEWQGIGVDFWKELAANLGMKCEYRECDYAKVAKLLADGTIDAAVGRLSALELHDPRIDFTYAFFFSGLALVVPKMTEQHHWLAVLDMLYESNFILVVGLILAAMILFGIAIWFLEHKHNPDHFASNAVKGISSGLWWSATTMTTVGYGDKVPQTIAGRLLALFWMILGIILVAVLTATITSMSTVSRLGNVYKQPTDLQSKRFGVVTASPGEKFVQRNGLTHQTTATIAGALKLLNTGKVDLVIDDHAFLKYYCNKHKNTGARVLPNQLTLKGYSFVLKKHSLLRDQLNQAINKDISLPNWHNILVKYLGH